VPIPAAVAPVVFPRRPLVYPDDVFRVPVLVVSYFPAVDGVVRRSVTGDIEAPIDVLRQHTIETTRRVVEALELGSVYRGYRDVAAQPALRYDVVHSVEFIEPLPASAKAGHTVPMTNYRAIMERINIGRWVQEEGVKEVWIWGYHGGVIDLWESNMAGPFGDISNSDRDAADLPVFDRTYTVYHYNYARGASEAVEDHMHQIEAVLRDRDEELFWRRFVGRPREARCGWAHFPPNGEHDYDWSNRKFVESDIEDWSPEGGTRRALNCERWGGDSLKWFIYWMESLPGRGNAITYRGRPLANWWTFIGDWDGAMKRGLGLVE